MKILDYMKKGLTNVINNNMIKNDIRQKATELFKDFKSFMLPDMEILKKNYKLLPIDRGFCSDTEEVENEKIIVLAEIQRIKVTQTRNHVESTMKIHQQITDDIVAFRQNQNNDSSQTGYHTPEPYITSEEEEENSSYYKSPRRVRKRPELNPFIADSGEINNGCDLQDSDDEYNADQTIVGGKGVEWIVNATLDENIVEQMLNDIRRNEDTTENNAGHDFKLFLNTIIDRDIKKTKETLEKKIDVSSFETKFALNFVRLMVNLMKNVNLLLDEMSEETYIVNVLDNERRSTGRKIDAIITLREEDEEFSIIEVSGPPAKKDWSHFKDDRMKLTKMLKTLINRLAELRPNSYITSVRLYGLQSYLNEFIVYEFQLKYAEIYTMKPVLKFRLPKTWKDMVKAHEIVMSLLKYESLLSESASTIRDFLWAE
ncbi:7990_t:CDS:2, partial [Paraglomus occultum]